MVKYGKVSSGAKPSVVEITNNNIKSYLDEIKELKACVQKLTNDAQKAANELKTTLNSCTTLKDSLKTEVSDLIELHSDNMNNPHYVTASQVDAYSKSELDTILSSGLDNKNPNLVAGNNIILNNNSDGTQTICASATVDLNYENLTNHPTINSVVLNGSKTAEDLGLANITDIPTNVSSLNNDVGYLTQHQDIGGKQDVLTAGDGVSIDNNIVSTVNRANTDLSNITNNGKKVIDGQWISAYNVLSTTKTRGTYTLDLSSYLPSDDNHYEVILYTHLLRTGSTSYASLYITIPFYDTEFPIANAEDAFGRNFFAIFPVIVTPSREISIRIVGSANPTACEITMLAYRRLGTNQ